MSLMGENMMILNELKIIVNIRVVLCCVVGCVEEC